MKDKQIKSSYTDFGQYEKLWGCHQDRCKKIIRITDKYIVFIDHKNDIDWETTDEFDSSQESEIKSSRVKAISKCQISEHKPTDGLNENAILGFKTIVSEGIVNCIEGNFDEAEDILREANLFRVARVVEKSREWHLTFTVILLLISIIAVFIVNSKYTFFSDSLEYINTGVWAVAGSSLSIILRTGNIQNASYSGATLHFIETGCRLIAGFISGQIVYLGIKSGIIFANIGDTHQNPYIIHFLALLAGGSERFAPSVIKKVDDSIFIPIPKPLKEIQK